ncbi:DMT family transporter [Sulfitobacter pseudonitzschiae]|uniref:DMT family transporter n=1 Tax=Pseudosulfitobacter pseudonitzschiae TaxID=1402135 RepID=A0A9Q2RS74_9RHOB|nr:MULTISPECIES: DMT family transporter [Roseobacteraceae]MBM2290777.1 DMT family transporter [Pseudosulfitobacter pseudonitzschiae]MBM2295695.1 DMT family transporter [Pseudosulfitobacter pseudonitzschiae]MBM2300607.1 DMT family transporter [Pseudosulfitobacter pseudonitzschiae]MBM2310392.1 DMT family transporter [Pseudosulfitobacter pseudonitzschiae]MBM2315304.1 DMT family transporter [Pseudosulfitobacter pseudonitzschiae]|tara:strand:+ start:9704 stop:10573 length:870 start_codon:yes stop_codon:yes gene_type:complete
MDIKAILMGVVFAFIWSSAFTSARIIVTDASPLAALSLRFFLSGIIGVIIARMMGQSWNLTRNQWRATFVFGLCQNAIYLGLNFYAVQTVPASLASIIASTMPLMVAAAGWIVFRDRLPLFGVIGLLMGIVGVVIIMSARMDAGADMRGVALCIIGAASLTIATLSMRGASSGGNLMMVVGLQMFVGAGVLAVASALTETLRFNPTPQFFAAFAYTMFAPGLLATYIWFSLVQRIGAVKAATFHFLNPFFGVAVAAVLLGEKLGAHDILGVVIIGLGILAVQLSRATKT